MCLASYTLLQGHSTAVLIDVPVFIENTLSLADYRSQIIGHKTISHACNTHGYGDHFLDRPALQNFSGVIAVATERAIAHVAQQSSYAKSVKFWPRVFPKQIPTQSETIYPVPFN